MSANLTSAILAVMGEVGYVHKGGKVSGGGMNYSFAGEADLLRVLRPRMVAAGLVMLPIGMTTEAVHEELPSKYGPKPSRTVRVVATYRLMHSSGEHVDIQAAGEGQDAGDKATAKAMTIALKYALRQAFLIETGDDPDRERPEPTDDDVRGYEARKIEALGDVRDEIRALFAAAGCERGDGSADAMVIASNAAGSLADIWGSVDGLQAVIDWIGTHPTPAEARTAAGVIIG